VSMGQESGTAAAAAAGGGGSSDSAARLSTLSVVSSLPPTDSLTLSNTANANSELLSSDPSTLPANQRVAKLKGSETIGYFKPPSKRVSIRDTQPSTNPMFFIPPFRDPAYDFEQEVQRFLLDLISFLTPSILFIS